MENKPNKMKLFRVSKDMTIEQFATEIGYSRRNYSLVERKIARPSHRMLEAIAGRFNMKISEVYQLFED